MANAARVVAGFIGWLKVTTTGAARVASSPCSGVTLTTVGGSGARVGVGSGAAVGGYVRRLAGAATAPPADAATGGANGRWGGPGRARPEDDEDENGQQVQEVTGAHRRLHLRGSARATGRLARYQVFGSVGR